MLHNDTTRREIRTEHTYKIYKRVQQNINRNNIRVLIKLINHDK